MKTSLFRHAHVFAWCAMLCITANAATLRIPTQFATIQAAIQAAAKGDTIMVAAGTYRERLVLKPGIIVRSEDDDTKGKIGLKRAEATILDGSVGSGAGVEMALEATLDGFTITGVGKYDEALWRHHFDTQGNEQPQEHIGEAGTPGIAVAVECEVRNNIVRHIGYTGIAITGGSPRIVGNVCFRNMGGGIGSMNGSAAVIEGNICFENFHAGIGCDASSPVVKGNVCHGNIRAGIGISEGSSPIVTGNRCFKNRRAGIGIRTGKDTRPVVEGNECSENDMAGIGVEQGARPLIVKNRIVGNKLVAIGVTGDSEATIKVNELARDGGVPPMIAVLDGSRAVVTGNTIRGGGVAGILVKGRAEIRDNHFIGNGPAAKPPANNAVWAQAGSEVRCIGNRIEAWKQAINVAKDAKVAAEDNSFLADIAFKSSLDGTEQRYVELLPPGFESSKQHDIVIALHGQGSDRWQFIKDARGECKGVRDVAVKFGLIVVSPDYRAKTSWMGPKAEADVVQIIVELKQRHKIGRVFIAGGSMGGTAALTFTAVHPELVAGVCSLNGTANLIEYEKFQDAISASFGGTKAEVPEEYRKRSAELWPEQFAMPVAVTTGGKDESVPPQSTLRLVEKLKQADRKVLSIHRETGGHSTTYEDTCAAMEFVLRGAAAPK